MHKHYVICIKKTTVMVKVSIVITTYNHKDFIKDTIESIINQSFSSWELLVWDDSPNNDTWDIIQQYVKKYPEKIKARHHSPNKWIVDNMNFLINKISKDSECVAFLEWDDVLKRDYLQKKLDIFNEYPGVNLVYNNIDFINSKWNIIQKDIFWFRHIKTYKNSIINPNDYVSVNVWPIISRSTIAVKKGIVDKYKIESLEPDNKSYAISDYDFCFNVSIENKVYYINDSLTLYRRHTFNLSAWNTNLLEQLSALITRYHEQWKISNKTYKTKLSQNNIMISLMLLESGNKKESYSYLEKSLKINPFNDIILKLWVILLLFMPQKLSKKIISKFVRRW